VTEIIEIQNTDRKFKGHISRDRNNGNTDKSQQDTSVATDIIEIKETQTVSQQNTWAVTEITEITEKYRQKVNRKH